MIDHAILSELAAGAALDDLDPLERPALEAHLATCARCRMLLADLEDVLGDLALVAPPMRPPASLRRGVMDRLRALS